jgi:hypothetical protein
MESSGAARPSLLTPDSCLLTTNNINLNQIGDYYDI